MGATARSAGTPCLGDALQHEAEPRFVLLETAREFGLECLAEAGEAEATRQAHYLKLAEAARPYVQGTEQGRWFDRLEPERENLRAALSWLLERAQVEAQTGEGRRKHAEQVLRLCAALFWFWYTRMSYYREGARFLEQALALSQGVDERLRISALSHAGAFYIELDALEQAVEVLEESLTLARALDDRARMAGALYLLGVYVEINGGRGTAARAQIEEAASLFRQVGDTWSRGCCLTELGRIATTQGEYDRASALLEEELALYRTLGDRFRIAHTLTLLSRSWCLKAREPELQPWPRSAWRSINRSAPKRAGRTPSSYWAKSP